MNNYAGMSDKDKEIAEELEIAGIEVRHLEFLRDQGEVKTSVFGELHRWRFKRAWYYWVASGPGIPLDYAKKLHEKSGDVIRVDGDCTCPHPGKYNGFAIGLYHIDSQLGLKDLADAIRQIVADNKAAQRPLKDEI